MNRNHGHFNAFIFFVLNALALALDNGLARQPPMGWLSWERFGCQTNCSEFPDTCISEKLYLNQARLLVEKGFQDAGYIYVNIDDCWSEMERENGKIVEDRSRFPSGLKNLSRELHSWGLRLGLYGDIGSKTCIGYPGFQGNFDMDAHTLAFDFEVDSIKVDACHANESEFNITYPAFGAALNRTGRPILYSCSWPNDYYERHNHWEDPDYLNHGIKQSCNLWRNYIDVSDSWEAILKIINFWERKGPQDVMVRAAGPGHWNDPDMLVIGNPGLSISEQQTQFALWSLFAAPLMISADLTAISDESRELLLNKEIISVNQDVLGRQGWCSEKSASGPQRVWVKELQPTWGQHCPPASSDTWAIVFQNSASIFGPTIISFEPEKHLPTTKVWNLFHVRDLIAHKNLGLFNSTFTALVDESSVMMYIVVAQCNNSQFTKPSGDSM
jgi:alpha-N-acetylgalactosaminidase